MNTNETPYYDSSDNPTGCCPRFNPEAWDGQELHFERKRFVRATTRSFFHIPLNMGAVFKRTFAAIEAACAMDKDHAIILSRDLSPWTSEHLFAVTREVPVEQMVELSGDFTTKVFEGPYRDAPKWEKSVATLAAERGRKILKSFFFYTTCPRCAKHYGKNYVVAVPQLG